MTRTTICALTASMVLILGGCSKGEFSLFNNDRSFSGALPVIEENASFFKVDLIEALDPQRQGMKAKLGDAPTNQQVRDSDKLELAFFGFYSPYYLSVSRSQEQRRNELQDRLIASSNQACAEFKRHLHAFQSQTNFLLGSLTTAVAGAGAIVSPANTARLLSGTAGVFSGVRAEFNEDFFVKLTAGVITKAVDNRRAELIREFQDKRGQPISGYTVERAVADAIYYNDVCSLIEGLQIASTAVTVAEDPGLKRLSRVLKESGFKSTVRLDVASEGDESAQGLPSILGSLVGVKDVETPAVFLGRTNARAGEAKGALTLRIDKAKAHAKVTDDQKKVLVETEKTRDNAWTALTGSLDAVKAEVNTRTTEYFDKVRKALEAADQVARGVAEADLKLAVANGEATKAKITAALNTLLEAYRKLGLDLAKIEEAQAKAT